MHALLLASTISAYATDLGGYLHARQFKVPWPGLCLPILHPWHCKPIRPQGPGAHVPPPPRPPRSSLGFPPGRVPDQGPPLFLDPCGLANILTVKKVQVLPSAALAVVDFPATCDLRPACSVDLHYYFSPPTTIYTKRPAVCVRLRPPQGSLLNSSSPLASNNGRTWSSNSVAARKGRLLLDLPIFYLPRRTLLPSLSTSFWSINAPV
ncbi:hypothetical protein BKA56DRAFT_220210 [Ilyonectria sp. MPI-CAGE-AT-0026]|nr:hypothetical protein BKA56DRAFT_220210 [Ilyonectria sp. MPI-CAGE-AT-0026]